MNRAQLIMARFDIAEYRLCRHLNRGAGSRSLRFVFCLASRLGDGIIWYVLVGLLPLLYGRAAMRPAISMAITGIIGLLIYKWLKQTLVRERPRTVLATLRHDFKTPLHSILATFESAGPSQLEM